MDAIAQEFGLTPSTTFDSTLLSSLLAKINEGLTESLDKLETTKRRLAPKIIEYENRKLKLEEEISELKTEACRLEAINPIAVLEKRRNDAKTEGEYIGKILNRDIHEEFVALMRNELKTSVLSFSASDSLAIEGLEHAQATFPGLEGLRERLQRRNALIYVSRNVEKLITQVNSIYDEISTSVYPSKPEKTAAFAEFCVTMLKNYFQRLFQSKSKVQSLPQFTALLTNDLSYAIVFSQCKFSSRPSVDSLKLIHSQIVASFLAKMRFEIDSITNDARNMPDLDRVFKRILLFLSRLNNVLRPISLKSDLANILFNLLKHYLTRSVQKVFDFGDIGSDEIIALQQFCWSSAGLPEKCFTDSELLNAISHILPDSKKLKAIGDFLGQNLIEIVNCYHRGDYLDKLTAKEISLLTDACFAGSPLKYGFIDELRLDMRVMRNQNWSDDL